jgi:outer membrane protein assembly factor BamE (lipoprotein component of BamABCDE complex)
MKRIFPVIAVVIAFLAGCANPASRSPLNQARVAMTLRKGATTQDEVLQRLGAPNIITTDSEDRETWTYQQHSVSGGSSAVNVQGAGIARAANAFFNPAVALGSIGATAYGQSSKTVTLTVKFNRQGVVDEYRSIYSSF